MDLPFDPLDYADTFAFPDRDGSHVMVEKMPLTDRWMIVQDRQVLTVHNVWIPLNDIDPAHPVDVALAAFDRDQALAVAYDHANRWRTA